MLPRVLFLWNPQNTLSFPGCTRPPGGQAAGPPRAALTLPVLLRWPRYARLQEWSDFIRFSSKAKTLVLRRTPTPLYLIGMCRYLEGQVLHLQKQIAELSENAQDSGVEIFKVRPPRPRRPLVNVPGRRGETHTRPRSAHAARPGSSPPGLVPRGSSEGRLHL